MGQLAGNIVFQQMKLSKGTINLLTLCLHRNEKRVVNIAQLVDYHWSG